MHKKKLHLDFRTKIFTTIVLSYTLLLGNLQSRYLVVAILASLLPYILLLLSRKYKSAIFGIVYIVIAALFQKYLVNNVTGFLTSISLFMTTIFLKMAPAIMMGKYTFMTTDMSELVVSLSKLKLPIQIIIPITVMARFFYTIIIDYKQIKNAMYLHGLTLRKFFFKPHKLIEYKLIPLLMVLMRTADDVSISALTRGLAIEGKRSSIVVTKFGFADMILFLIMAILIAFYIGGKYA